MVAGKFKRSSKLNFSKNKICYYNNTISLSRHEISSKESVVSSLFNRAYSIITNKDDLDKENARIKQVLKENGYQESIISKIFKRITNNHSLPQSQQQMQATDIQEEEIRMSINLLYWRYRVKNYSVYTDFTK